VVGKVGALRVRVRKKIKYNELIFIKVFYFFNILCIFVTNSTNLPTIFIINKYFYLLAHVGYVGSMRAHTKEK